MVASFANFLGGPRAPQPGAFPNALGEPVRQAAPNPFDQFDAPATQAPAQQPAMAPPLQQIRPPRPRQPTPPSPTEIRRTELAEDKAARDEAEWNATHNPDGSPKTAPGAVPPKGSMEEARRNAELLLQAAGVDIARGVDPIKDLIAGSTSGGLERAGAEAYGWVTGDATTGMENIAKLQTIVSDMTLQLTGGSLGNQISNADREFIMQRVGNLGDPSVPASARLAAWEQVKQRMGNLTGAAAPVAGEGAGEPANLWPGVVGQDGKPLPPEGGYGRDPETGEWAFYGRVTDEGPPPPPPAAPSGPGIGQHLLDATQSTAAGLAQGVAGLGDLAMDASTGVQRVVNYGEGRGGEALLDAIGLPGAADWWRRGADLNEQALADRPSAVDAIEELSPTPEGHEAARFVSQLVGGAMVPFGPKAVPRVTAPRTSAAAQAATPPAREIIEDGARNKVRVMTSDVRPPRTFIGKSARAIGERIPIAGTGGPRAAQQEERVEAVRSLARETGADVGTELLDEVTDDFAKTRGAQLTALTRRKNDVIDSVAVPLQPINVVRTLEAIDSQIRRLAGIDATEYAPVTDRLARFGVNIASGKSLRQVEENRKLLGAMFEDAGLASLKTEGQKAINAIYNPLREDMGAFIRENAGDAAQSQWAKANQQLSELAGELDDRVFAGVLRSADTTPENVGRLLFSRKPSEVRRLVANLSPEGRSKAQAAIIQRAIEKAGGIDNISPDKFANEIGRLGRSVGVVFEGADLARIKGLERLLQATKQASVASAAPPTGVQNVPLLMGAGVGATGGTAAVPLAAIGGLARLYESAPIRNMLAGLGMSKPGSTNESRLLERILKAATSQAEIRGPAANDVLAASPTRAAASEQEID